MLVAFVVFGGGVGGGVGGGGGVDIDIVVVVAIVAAAGFHAHRWIRILPIGRPNFSQCSWVQLEISC